MAWARKSNQTCYLPLKLSSHQVFKVKELVIHHSNGLPRKCPKSRQLVQTRTPNVRFHVNWWEGLPFLPSFRSPARLSVRVFRLLTRLPRRESSKESVRLTRPDWTDNILWFVSVFTGLHDNLQFQLVVCLSFHRASFLPTAGCCSSVLTGATVVSLYVPPTHITQD